MSAVNKVKNSLLFLTQTLDDLKFNLKYILEESFKYTNENLYIYINPLASNKSKLSYQSPQLLLLNDEPKLINDKYNLKLLLNKCYQNSFSLNPNVNVTCLLNNVHSSMLNKNKFNLDYDLILTDLAINSSDSPVYSNLIQFCNSNLPNKKNANMPFYSINCNQGTSEFNLAPLEESVHSENDLIYANNVFENSIIGGTFDRLHIGHKIMLSEAVLLTKNRLLVGVTAESMLRKKKLAELIQNFDLRCANVNLFLKYFRSTNVLIHFCQQGKKVS